VHRERLGKTVARSIVVVERRRLRWGMLEIIIST
jgi:hypothetical protein